MNIQRIETYTHGSLSMVKVVTDDGAEGIGQIAPFNADISASVSHRQVAPHALGWDALDRDGLSVRCIIPDGSGWGVTISDEWLATADREVSERE